MPKPSKKQKPAEPLVTDGEMAQLTEDLQRIQADFINFKRRAEEDKLRYTRLGRESAVMALLPVVDNFERSFQHIPEQIAQDDWVSGIKAVAKQLVGALKSLGVERIDCVGKEFDPNLHEAIQMDESKGKKEVVVEELQPGYIMDGEVIRHAMVKVGRK